MLLTSTFPSPRKARGSSLQFLPVCCW
uniref:Uncharacterized protein n=1 Tax=Rhizophora mucronata TaxID=61149 RepID=A0A2P2N9Y0_RHIMU